MDTTYIFNRSCSCYCRYRGDLQHTPQQKINDNGIEADAVISRIDIDTDVDGGVTENKTY